MLTNMWVKGLRTCSWPLFSADRPKHTGCSCEAGSSPGFTACERAGLFLCVWTSVCSVGPVRWRQALPFVLSQLTHVWGTRSPLLRGWRVCEPLPSAPRLPGWRCWGSGPSVTAAVKPHPSNCRGLLLWMDSHSLGCSLWTGQHAITGYSIVVSMKHERGLK